MKGRQKSRPAKRAFFCAQSFRKRVASIQNTDAWKELLFGRGGARQTAVFIGRIRGWLIPAALGHRQVSLDEYLFPCPLKTRPPEGWKTPGRRCRGKRSFLAPSMSLDTYPRFNPETAPIKVRPESSARMQQRQRGFPLCPAWLRFWHPFSTSNPADRVFFQQGATR
jgi:hypothetical protein